MYARFLVAAQEVAPLIADLGLSGEDGASARLALILLAFVISICCTGERRPPIRTRAQYA